VFDDKLLVTGGIMNCLSGAVDAATRNSRCAASNSPLLPGILVCTSIGSEGIDLHLYCDDVIHHDLPWNHAKLEQRELPTGCGSWITRTTSPMSWTASSRFIGRSWSATEKRCPHCDRRRKWLASPSTG